MPEVLFKKDFQEIKICVMGLGYVGLPTALHFANSGLKVIAFDIDKKKIEGLKEGKLSFLDVGLELNFQQATKTKNVKYTYIPKDIKEADFVLIIVPTPVDSKKIPDLSYVSNAARLIGKNLKRNAIIVLESTVYPGTTEELVGPIIERESGKKQSEEFFLAYVPERYNPGDEENTLVRVNRIVGAENSEIAQKVADLYKRIVESEVFIVQNIKTAETAKVIENTQRDLNIALMNEIALICEKLGIDVIDVINAAKTKWNFVPYYPGAGVGGHCLPHDPFYLTMKAQELGYFPQIILAGRRLNDSMPYHMVYLIQDTLNEMKKPLKDCKILVLGASYKEETGDLRSSPSEIVVKELVDKGSQITIIDPYIDKDILWGVKLFREITSQIIENIDCIVLMTNHRYFSESLLLNIREQMQKNRVAFIDGRRKINPDKINEKYIYRGIGDGLRKPEF